MRNTKSYHVTNHNQYGEWRLVTYSVRRGNGCLQVTKDGQSLPERDEVLVDNLTDECKSLEIAKEFAEQEAEILRAAGYTISIDRNFTDNTPPLIG